MNVDLVERSPLAKAAVGLLAVVGNSTRRIRIHSLFAALRFWPARAFRLRHYRTARPDPAGLTRVAMHGVRGRYLESSARNRQRNYDRDGLW
jgi:hypothetical protein